MGGRIQSPRRAAYGGVLFGGEGWIERMRCPLASEVDDPNVPARRHLAMPGDPAKLARPSVFRSILIACSDEK